MATENKQPVFINWNEMKKAFLRQLRCENTRLAYKYALKNFKDFMVVNYRQIDPLFGDYLPLRKAIEDWVWEGTSHVKERTMGARLVALSSFYDFLVTQYCVIDKNPARKLKVTNLSTPAVVQIPSSEQVDAVLAQIQATNTGLDDIISRRDWLIISLLREGGFRVSELRQLHVRDINPDTGHVRIRVGKGNKSRITAVLPETATEAHLFARHNDIVPNEPFLLGIQYYSLPWTAKRRALKTRGHGPYSVKGITHMLKRRAERAGFEDSDLRVLGHPHSYRHVWTVAHVKNDTNLIVLMKMGGWKNSDMISYYAGEAAIGIHAVPR